MPAMHTFAKIELWSSKIQNIDPLLKQTSFRTPENNPEMIHPAFHLLHLLKWESEVQHMCIWQRLDLNLQHVDSHSHQNPCLNKGSFCCHAFEVYFKNEIITGPILLRTENVHILLQITHEHGQEYCM